jgi:molecular chaperone IbpA
MRTTFDFTPLMRSSIGFDRLFDLLENTSRLQLIDNWPPYDIVKTGGDAYRITMAVAGFDENELSVTQEPNLLIVSGSKSGEAVEDGQVQYLHRGIAGRAFQRRFELADYVKVAGARLENGLLIIDLVREVPEEMKPRQIEVKSGEAVAEPAKRQIEGQSKAA